MSYYYGQSKLGAFGKGMIAPPPEPPPSSELPPEELPPEEFPPETLPPEEFAPPPPVDFVLPPLMLEEEEEGMSPLLPILILLGLGALALPFILRKKKEV